MIEIFLSSDGKHTVRGQAEKENEATAMYEMISVLYDRILEDYGAGTKQGESLEKEKKEEDAPLCPIHRVAMKYVPAGVSKKTGNKYGAFYACTFMDCKQTLKVQ